MNLSNLGFQLSFLATFAILFLMPTTTSWMHKLFPVRSLKTTLQMPFLDRWMYLVCCLLRSAFALNLAVHLVIVPVCLFYFQKFPVLGLLYNLFIPFLISLGLSAFFLSILLLWIFPPLGKLFLSGLELFMSEVLALICQSPLCLDLSLRLKLFPLFFLVMVLCLVFSLPFRKLILLKLLPSQETKNPLRL
jgi:competence protein ComEC